MLNHRDSTSKSTKRLPQFNADVPAAHDEKVLGQAIQFQSRLTGQRFGSEQALDRWDPGLGSQVNKQFVAGEEPDRSTLRGMKFDRAWSDESSFAQDEAVAYRSVQIVPIEIDHPRDHRPL